MVYTIKQLIFGTLIGSHITDICKMDTLNDAKVLVNILIDLNKCFDDYAIFDDMGQALWRKYENEVWA